MTLHSIMSTGTVTAGTVTSKKNKKDAATQLSKFPLSVSTSVAEGDPCTPFVLAEVVRPVVGKYRHARKRVLLNVLECRPHLHHEHGRLHLGRGRQVLHTAERHPNFYPSDHYNHHCATIKSFRLPVQLQSPE